MSHLAQQIVNAVKTAMTGLTTTGANVFDGDPRVLDSSTLPALVIKEGVDNANPLTKLFPRLIGHTLQLSVTGYVKTSSQSVPTTLREIRLEVEKAMVAVSPNLGQLTRDIRCTGAGERQNDYDAETPVALMSINFEIDYCHSETTPDVAN